MCVFLCLWVPFPLSHPSLFSPVPVPLWTCLSMCCMSVNKASQDCGTLHLDLHQDSIPVSFFFPRWPYAVFFSWLFSSFAFVLQLFFSFPFSSFLTSSFLSFFFVLAPEGCLSLFWSYRTCMHCTCIRLSCILVRCACVSHILHRLLAPGRCFLSGRIGSSVYILECWCFLSRSRLSSWCKLYGVLWADEKIEGIPLLLVPRSQTSRGRSYVLSPPQSLHLYCCVVGAHGRSLLQLRPWGTLEIKNWGYHFWGSFVVNFFFILF